jgi:hypothetical protein
MCHHPAHIAFDIGLLLLLLRVQSAVRQGGFIVIMSSGVFYHEDTVHNGYMSYAMYE